MHRLHLLTLASALLAAPLAYAHVDGMPYGTPKFYCEDAPGAGDQLTHDYGVGFLLSGPMDGSTPLGLYPVLPGGCHYPTSLPNGWDGHYEYAGGGAWLLACELACPGHDQSGNPVMGDGSLVCFGTYADHSVFPTVWAFDHVLSTFGADVTFSVYTDTIDKFPDPTGTAPSCGDFEADSGADCVNHCSVGFGPGLDGAYMVFVTGTQGHIWTAA